MGSPEKIVAQILEAAGRVYSVSGAGYPGRGTWGPDSRLGEEGGEMNLLDQRTAAANRYFEWPVYWSPQFLCGTTLLIVTLFQATRMVTPYWSTMPPMLQFLTAWMLLMLPLPWITWLALDRKLRVLLESGEIAQPRLEGNLTVAGRLAGTLLKILVSAYIALFFSLVVSGRILRSLG